MSTAPNPSDGKPAAGAIAEAAAQLAPALAMFGVRPKTPPASPPANPALAAAAVGAGAANAGASAAATPAPVANDNRAAPAPAPSTADATAATTDAPTKDDAKPPEAPKPTIAKAKLPTTPLGQMSEADRLAIAEVQGGETEAGSAVLAKILKAIEPYIHHLNTDEPFDLKAFNTETMTLYHAVFVACTTGQQEVNPATLYNGYLESVQGFVASVAEPKLAAGEKKAATDSEAMSESLVDAFSRMWAKHTALIKHLHKIFLYLDRCQPLLDQSILRIKPAGLNVFRTLVLEPYSTKIRDALLKGLEIEADKRSTAQKEVIAAAVATFTELGKEFADPYLQGTAASAKDDKLLKAHLKDMFTDTHKALLAPEPVAPPPQPPQHHQQPYPYHDEPMNRGGGGAKDYKRGGGGNPYANDGMDMGMGMGGQPPPRGGRRGDPYARDPYRRGGDPYLHDPYSDAPYDAYADPYRDPYGDPYARAGYRDRNGGRRHGGDGGRGGHGGGGGGGGRRAGGPTIACPTCTLENPSQNYRCEACGANLPAPNAAVVGGGKANAKEPDPAKAPAKSAEPDGGKADPKPAGGGGGADDTWTCRACTFSNPSAFPRCNMCDSAR